MKSPITGKKMKLYKRKRTLMHNGKRYTIPFYFYKCEESGEQFTTTELDEHNIGQVFKQVEKAKKNK